MLLPPLGRDACPMKPQQPAPSPPRALRAVAASRNQVVRNQVVQSALSPVHGAEGDDAASARGARGTHPAAPGGRGTAKVAIVGAGRVGTTLAREHGDSEVPLWSSATIGGVPLSQWKNAGLLPLDTTARADIFRRVVGGGGEVIAGKGFTTTRSASRPPASSSRCSTTSTRCCRSAH